VLAAALALSCSAPAIPPPVVYPAAAVDEQTAKPNPNNADPNLNPPFGPFDVQTVFYIEKSDGKDRVDYGMRLDRHCAPAGDSVVFPYWREFEHPPPVRSHPLKAIQYLAYGFSEQRLVERGARGGKYLVQLKQVDRPILIVTGLGADARCVATAYTKIRGVEGARLDRIFVKVSGFASADYVDVHGFDAKTGQKLVERLKQ